MAAPDLIIGLGHRKRVGKDAFAEFLDNELAKRGCRVFRLAFANEMKDSAFQLFDMLGLKTRIYYDKYPEERKYCLPVGTKTPRQIWIEYGNAMRSIYPDIWVDKLYCALYDVQHFTTRNVFQPRAYIIPDVRFPNEANAVKSWGGLLFKIERPGAPVDSDGADDALDEYDGWDDIIHNDAGLGELSAEASKLAQRLVAQMCRDHSFTPFTGDR